MRDARRCLWIALGALVLFGTGEALAFKLRPHGTDTEKRVRYLEQSLFGNLTDKTLSRVIDHFTSPVHEEITHRVWGCETNPTDDCLNPAPFGKYAPAAVLYGVQWSDNPPFTLTSTTTSGCPVDKVIRLPNFSQCWAKLFQDAGKRAGKSEHFDHRTSVALLYRVHFGDMQFLHSMASWDGEEMGHTKTRILMWAEIAYRTATKEFPSTSLFSESPVSGIPRLFGSKGVSMESLLTWGVPEYRNRVDNVALGTFMHMVQDSFAKGHVMREAQTGQACPAYPKVRKAGRVLAFNSYTNQDAGEHGKADSRNGFEAHFIVANPTVVDVGRAVKAMWEASTPWTNVRAFLDQCVFEIAADDLDKVAGPGDGFVRP